MFLGILALMVVVGYDLFLMFSFPTMQLPPSYFPLEERAQDVVANQSASTTTRTTTRTARAITHRNDDNTETNQDGKGNDKITNRPMSMLDNAGSLTPSSSSFAKSSSSKQSDTSLGGRTTTTSVRQQQRKRQQRSPPEAECDQVLVQRGRNQWINQTLVKDFSRMKACGPKILIIGASKYCSRHFRSTDRSIGRNLAFYFLALLGRAISRMIGVPLYVCLSSFALDSQSLYLCCLLHLLSYGYCWI